MKTLLIISMILLSGCASDRTLLDRLEFGEDEYGCARVQGNATVSNNPFAGADAQVLIIKRKDNPDGSPGPDC